MLSAPDLGSIQISLFYTEKLSNPATLWPSLTKGKLGELFSHKPLIIPLPDDIDLDDAPAVTLSSPKAPHQLFLTRKRANLIWMYSDADRRQLEEIKNEFFVLSKELCEVVLSSRSIGRVGFVNKFFYPTAEADRLIGNLLTASARQMHGDSSIEESSIKVVTREHYDKYKVNNNSYLTRGIRTEKTGELKGIMLTRDMNTLAEEKYEFHWNNIEGFMNWSLTKLNLDKFTQLLSQ